MKHPLEKPNFPALPPAKHFAGTRPVLRQDHALRGLSTPCRQRLDILWLFRFASLRKESGYKQRKFNMLLIRVRDKDRKPRACRKIAAYSPFFLHPGGACAPERMSKRGARHLPWTRGAPLAPAGDAGYKSPWLLS